MRARASGGTTLAFSFPELTGERAAVTSAGGGVLDALLATMYEAEQSTLDGAPHLGGFNRALSTLASELVAKKRARALAAAAEGSGGDGRAGGGGGGGGGVFARTPAGGSKRVFAGVSSGAARSVRPRASSGGGSRGNGRKRSAGASTAPSAGVRVGGTRATDAVEVESSGSESDESEEEEAASDSEDETWEALAQALAVTRLGGAAAPASAWARAFEPFGGGAAVEAGASAGVSAGALYAALLIPVTLLLSHVHSVATDREIASQIETRSAADVGEGAGLGGAAGGAANESMGGVEGHRTSSVGVVDFGQSIYPSVVDALGLSRLVAALPPPPPPAFDAAEAAAHALNTAAFESSAAAGLDAVSPGAALLDCARLRVAPLVIAAARACAHDGADILRTWVSRRAGWGRERATLLHLAVYGGAAPAAALLLGVGADVRAVGTVISRPNDGFMGLACEDSSPLDLARDVRGKLAIAGGGGRAQAVRAGIAGAIVELVAHAAGEPAEQKGLPRRRSRA